MKTRQCGTTTVAVLTGTLVLIVVGLAIGAFTWALGENWSLGPVSVQGRGQSAYGSIGTERDAATRAAEAAKQKAQEAARAEAAARQKAQEDAQAEAAKQKMAEEAAAKAKAEAQAKAGTQPPAAAAPAAPAPATATTQPPAAASTQPAVPAAQAPQQQAPQQTAPRTAAPKSTASPHKGDTVEKVAAGAYKVLGAVPGGQQLESFTIQKRGDKGQPVAGRKCVDGTEPVLVKTGEDAKYDYFRWHCPNDKAS